MATAHRLDFPSSRAERPFTQAIEERRATMQFDDTPVPVEDLAAIVRAGLEAPSGYNLQPWRFVIVRDPEQRKRLREAARNQSKVEEAPVVIVACGDLQGWRNGDLEKMLHLAAEHHHGTPESHERVRSNVTGILSSPPGNAMGVAPDWAVWINRHVMIAFTTMMWMAEVLGYNTAPMEGFFEDKVRAVLGIPEHVRVVALLAIGRRKGPVKPYGGRFGPDRTCFADQWGKHLDFSPLVAS
jgi:nitroreductase